MTESGPPAPASPARYQTATTQADGSPLPAAVLWDMDGTLLDSEPYWMAAQEELAVQHGASWTHEQALAMVGTPLLTGAEIFQRATGVPGAREEIVEWFLENVIDQLRRLGAPWRPGALALLESLRDAGVPCVLVTMSYENLARAVVEQVPGLFDGVISGDMVARGKPHPEAYLTAAERLGVEITACVAIEDSVPGVASALASGARSIAVPLHVPIEARPGLSRVRTLEDVDLAVLRRILAGEDLDLVEQIGDGHQ